jgi:negative regulator of replication initiation
MDNMDKTKIQIDRDLARFLKQRKDIGETYSDVIRRQFKGVR